MAKKILYIVLGALAVFGLLFLLWSWFFSGSTSNTPQTGTFGTASSTGNFSGTTAGNNTNGEVPLGSNAQNGAIPLGSNGGGTTIAGGSGSVGGAPITGGTITNPVLQPIGVTTVPGVQWLGSTGGGSSFTAVDINQLQSGNFGGSVTINSAAGTGSSGLGLGTALLGAGITGAISCGLLASSAAAPAAAAGAAAGPAALGVPIGGGTQLIIAGSVGSLATQQTANQTRSFQGCLINIIGKTILQQITASVVQWINSGFNGQPSFVTNYQQFFTNVADQAAGAFIQGTGLAFLCSPFQLQIKVAIAQAYAQRNAAASCSLSKVIGDVNGFMNGNFSSGGWPGFLSFTTVPTNNPYGAYAYAQVGLNNAQSAAIQNANRNITPNGFISVQQCTPPGSTNCKVVTPGKAIEDSLQKTITAPIDQLGLANDLDQIINALLNQLMLKTLYSGLGSAAQSLGGVDTQATTDAQNLLDELQTAGSLAQQYGSIEQGSIQDIESAQNQLNTLANCWSVAASSTSISADASSLASNNAASAQSQITALNTQIDSYNTAITNTNAVIASLEELQTQALSVASDSDVAAVQSQYDALSSAGQLISQTDVTTAQQNRTTLQSQMSALNTSTQAGLAQCQAFN